MNLHILGPHCRGGQGIFQGGCRGGQSKIQVDGRGGKPFFKVEFYRHMAIYHRSCTTPQPSSLFPFSFQALDHYIKACTSITSLWCNLRPQVCPRCGSVSPQISQKVSRRNAKHYVQFIGFAEGGGWESIKGPFKT